MGVVLSKIVRGQYNQEDQGPGVKHVTSESEARSCRAAPVLDVRLRRLSSGLRAETLPPSSVYGQVTASLPYSHHSLRVESGTCLCVTPVLQTLLPPGALGPTISKDGGVRGGGEDRC